MARPIFRWRVEKEEAPILLRAFLCEKKLVSKRLLAAVKFKGGMLKVNGQQATVRKQLNEGDEVIMELAPEEKSTFLEPENLDFNICYEDRDVLVVEKPAQMATIPSIDKPRGSLANAVMFYYQEAGIESTFHAVNRLDKGTSGLLIVAKHRYAHDLLAKAQLTGKVKRSYKALVEGRLPTRNGIIDKPIGRKPSSIIEREVRADGKKAITHYWVEAQSSNHSLVSLELRTGRTHQIRVHMADFG
ncbi:RluA family pseudouridine synthase, partial [Bacillus sp. JCM 19041]|uniref:RluA family pseudouridine synthase n=1 Tax=Bacillus sp. JCM 19041 TaxID=1460637 RepID=UPI0006D29F0B